MQRDRVHVEIEQLDHTQMAQRTYNTRTVHGCQCRYNCEGCTAQ